MTGQTQTPGPQTIEPPNPHDDPARWTPRLERILDEQESLYASLDELSETQRERIESDDAERLIDVLRSRQSILAKLEASNQSFAPFRERWSELMDRLDEPRRTAFNRRIDALAERIERIARRDEDDRNALEERRVQVAQALTDMTRGRAAVSAYQRPGAAPPANRYQDREG